jgi:hypothetical protein
MKYDFEATFKKFVKEFPGELVAESDVRNADFFFPQDNIVAELKTLQEDARQEYEIKLRDRAADWQRRRLMLIYGTVSISLETVPEVCQREWLGILQPPIENIIRKANRQIRSTKQSKNCLDARGLLLIANDGNFLHTSPNDYMILVARILGKRDQKGQPRFPHIHGVVYFSYRIRSRDEGLPFWAPGYVKRGGDPAMTEFQQRLRLGWFSYLSKISFDAD